MTNQEQFKSQTPAFTTNCTSVSSPSGGGKLFANAVRNSDGSTYDLFVNSAIAYANGSSGPVLIKSSDGKEITIAVRNKSGGDVAWDGILCLTDLNNASEFFLVKNTDIKSVLYTGSGVSASTYTGVRTAYKNIAKEIKGSSLGEGKEYKEGACYLSVHIPKGGIKVVTGQGSGGAASYLSVPSASYLEAVGIGGSSSWSPM